MRKIIDRLINRLFPPEQQQQIPKVISFNVPLERLAEWTAETLEDWLKLIGTPDNKIKETVLDIRLQAERAGVSLKEPRRVWNKFTVGQNLTFDELVEQQDAICELLGFGEKYEDYAEKDGVGLCIIRTTNANSNTGSISSLRLHRIVDSNFVDRQQFPVVDSQLDLDEIRAAIAKLKENANANK